LPVFPLLALHKFHASNFAKDQVNASILASAPSFLDRITDPPECFTDECFELAPSHRCKAIESGLRFEKLLAFSLLQPR
jgi:hypothetical protein